MASKTAEFVAFYRALETSEEVPLFCDPFAVGFLSPSLVFALRAASIAPLRSLLERYADWRAPGARTSAIARTCFIDGVVRRVAAEQLVILGAGYDCRAHRMPELRNTPVFELDRPATQNLKRERLREEPGVRDVIYVALDFAVDDFMEKLSASGWARDRTTVFIWEGVTNYLTEASVAKVLTAIGALPPDNTLVFTYIHRGVLDGTVTFEGADKLVKNVKAMREPWTFGLHPDELAKYLARFGLCLSEDLSADDYRRRYLGSSAMPGYAFYRIAVTHTNGG